VPEQNVRASAPRQPELQLVSGPAASQCATALQFSCYRDGLATNEQEDVEFDDYTHDFQIEEDESYRELLDSKSESEFLSPN
jgi:hypothetical protein